MKLFRLFMVLAAAAVLTGACTPSKECGYARSGEWPLLVKLNPDERQEFIRHYCGL